MRVEQFLDFGLKIPVINRFCVPQLDGRSQVRDRSIIWEGHKAGFDIRYCQIEKLANLDQLPAAGFLVSCFPFKIKSASAGFTRAVAII